MSNQQNDIILENLNELEEKVAEEVDSVREHSAYINEPFATDDDSDNKVDNGNYPGDMDKTLI